MPVLYELVAYKYAASTRPNSDHVIFALESLKCEQA
jgi:hypothetical protein